MAVHHKLYDTPERIAEATRVRHWQSYLTSLYGVPEDLSGLTVLDVGSNVGSLSFELEARGAQVTAGDLYDPTHNRGSVYKSIVAAKKLLESKVEIVTVNILWPEPVNLPQFDIVFCSDVLHHTKSPLLAVEHICAFAKRFVFISVDCYFDSVLPFLYYHPGKRNDFLYPTQGCLVKMMVDYGCKDIQVVSKHGSSELFRLIYVRAEKA